MAAGEIDLGIDGLTDYKEIGSGGFATVYSALEMALDRRVAVKVLAGMDEPGRRRFDRERLSMGRTADHPNIVTPLRSGYTGPDNKPYLMMEYLAGGSLQDRLDTDGPLPWGEAIRLILPIADALGFSHTSGVIHRDVKPANILISRTGVVKLTDFGIAAIREATATSQVAFSLLYTAPETFDAHHDPDTGRPIDPRTERSDLYSLAATLYALGTRRPPFQSTSSAGLMKQILTDPVPPTGHDDLDRFFATTMAKDPADRHPTAAQFTEHLLTVDLNPTDLATVVTPVDHLVIRPEMSQRPTPSRDLDEPVAPPHLPVESKLSTRRHRAARRLLIPLLVSMAIGILGYLAPLWYSRSFWFVQAADNGRVAVFQGKPAGFLWAEPVLKDATGPQVANLFPNQQAEVQQPREFRSRQAAQEYVDQLAQKNGACREVCGSG